MTATDSKMGGLRTYLLIVAGAFLVYAGTIGSGFVWDDLLLISETDAFRTWSNFGRFFTTTYWNLAWGLAHPYYRPMQPVLILLTSLFSGTNPLGYHIVGILFHGSVTWFFYRFLSHLNVSPWARNAAVVTFLAHPIHVEVVAWVNCAPIMCAGICFLAILTGSEKCREGSGLRRWLRLFLMLLLYIVGLLSYDLMFSLILVVFCYDMIRPGRIARKKPVSLMAVEYGGYIIIALAVLAVRINILHGMGAFDFWARVDPNGANVLYSGARLERVLGPLNILCRYVLLLLFPLHLSPEYYFPAARWDTSSIAALLLFALITILVYRRSHDRKPLYFSLAWMGVCLLPAAHIIPQGGIFADRLLYFSSWGFSLWLGLSFESARESAESRWKKWGHAVVLSILILVLAGFTVKTICQSRIWKDNLTFWIEVSALSPEKPRVQNELGVALLLTGHAEEAADAFREALRLSPTFEKARANLLRAEQQIDRP